MHFYNDYLSGQPYRASAQIQTHTHAYSGANVLVNMYSSPEFSSSKNVTLSFWFDDSIASLRVWLGTTTDCSSQVSGTIALYDLAGNTRDSASITASSSFNTYVQLDDSAEKGRVVVIDYGTTTCPEAIDELAFKAGSGESYDTSKPTITITSHTDNQSVNEAITNIEGTLYDYSGILTSVKVNAQAAQFYPISGAVGNFKFRQHVTLVEGANKFVAAVKDSIPYTSSDSVTIYLGTPASVTLSQFHLTQRGLMVNESCDVDSSLVAGKPALVRVTMPAYTASGAKTYVTNVQMMVYEWGTFTTPILTMWSDEYSSYTGQFESPSQYAGFNFIIPGDTFKALDYKFVFQAYAGISAIGSPITADCAGEYLVFYETNPVRLFIQPVEASSTNSNQPSDYVKNMYIQFDTIERTYPIREGYGPPWYSNRGFYYLEAAPLRLCDGTQAMANNFPDWCKGTGWTWKLIDKDSSGELHRTNVTRTYDQNHSFCNTNDHTIGAIYGSTVYTDTTHTLTFKPALGVFISGAHPDWYNAKHAAGIDYDHDGELDDDDIDHLVAEYLDLQTNTWITGTTGYENGDTFRFFNDEDGNQCNNQNDETQADVITLWKNANTVAFGPANEAMKTWNNQHKGLYTSFSIASEWFSPVLNPEDEGFGTWGPGSSYGTTTWIRVKKDQTMAHELGHSAGGLKDSYIPSTGECYLKNKQIKPWAAFINYKSVSVSDLWDVMDCSDMEPNQYFFSDSNYSALFEKLKKSTLSTLDSDQTDDQFLLSGWLYPADGYAEAQSSLTSGQGLLPPDPTSLYRLVFGQGASTLMEYPFNPISAVNPPQGFPTWEPGFSYFSVVTAYPAGTEWVELRRDSQVFWRGDKTLAVPTVTLLSPAGGEVLGANAEVVIHWSASDPDSSNLRFSILYSPDNGTTWNVVAAGLAGDTYTWKAANSPGTVGNAGKIKVVASDGFNQKESQNTQPFNLGGKPPQVAILSPQAGETYLSCEKIYFKGVMLDPEGQLDHTTFRVDGQVVLLVNPGWLAPLEDGDHTLTLEAFDQQGLSSSDSVTITVKNDLDCDGMSDEYEITFGLQEGDPNDAAPDFDQDGLINFDEAWYGTSPIEPDSDHDGYLDGQEVDMHSNPLDPLSKPSVSIYLPLVSR